MCDFEFELVESFCNPDLFMHVVDCEFTSCSSLAKVSVKILVCKFASLVRSQVFDPDRQLGLKRTVQGLVCLKSVAFGLEEVDMRISGCVIMEVNRVLCSSEADDFSLTP